MSDNKLPSSDPTTDDPLSFAYADEITLLPEPTVQRLDPRQQLDYAAVRRSWLQWCLQFGKHPRNADGYAVSTVRVRANIVDQFCRWVWDREGDYTTQITHDHGDAYLREIAVGDTTQEHKLNVVKALQMWFAWTAAERGGDEWEPPFSFSQPQRRDTTGDAFDRRERRQIREAALSYGAIPHYSAVDPDERDRWKGYLARRFDKPKAEVAVADWDRANGWKYPSLVWTSLDAALRPIEVAKAKLSWVDIDRQRLVIPKEDDVKTKRTDKQREWTVALTERTTAALERWLRQRACYEKYDDSEKLWLTRYGNPYQSSSLKKLVMKLTEIAGIDTSHRKVSWYSIRRGTVTEIVEESDLSTAAEQVRHVDIRSTARYDQVSDKRRREVLERLG